METFCGEIRRHCRANDEDTNGPHMLDEDEIGYNLSDDLLDELFERTLPHTMRYLKSHRIPARFGNLECCTCCNLH